MKTVVLCFILLFALIFSTLTSSAQPDNLYAKGNFYFSLNQQMNFKFKSKKSEGEKINNSYGSYVDAWGCYHFIDNLAFDFGFYHNKSVTKNGGKSTDGSNMLYLGAQFGRQVKDINLQAYALVGLGASSYQYTEDYTEKDTDIDFMFGIESPINISGSCKGLLTPGVGIYYSHSSWKGEEGNEVYNPGGKCSKTSFFFDVDLSFFIPRNEFSCDIKDKCALSSGTYEKGGSMFGVKSFMDFRVGGGKVNYDETEYSYYYDYNYSFTDLGFDALWYYYVINNLAVGLDLGYSCYGDKSKDDDSKYRSREFLFMPGVMYNLPLEGCLNNLFVNAGIGYGMERDKYIYDDSDSKSGNNIFAWNLGAGYNYFFTKQLSLTPRIFYDSRSYKPAETKGGDRGILSTHEYKEAGVVISFGLSYFIKGNSESSRFID